MSLKEKIQDLLALQQNIIRSLRTEDWESLTSLVNNKHQAYTCLFSDHPNEKLYKNLTELKTLKQIEDQILNEVKGMQNDLINEIFVLKNNERVRKSYSEF